MEYEPDEKQLNVRGPFLEPVSSDSSIPCPIIDKLHLAFGKWEAGVQMAFGGRGLPMSHSGGSRTLTLAPNGELKVAFVPLGT